MTETGIIDTKGNKYTYYISTDCTGTTTTEKRTKKELWNNDWSHCSGINKTIGSKKPLTSADNDWWYEIEDHTIDIPITFSYMSPKGTFGDKHVSSKKRIQKNSQFRFGLIYNSEEIKDKNLFYTKIKTCVPAGIDQNKFLKSINSMIPITMSSTIVIDAKKINELSEEEKIIFFAGNIVDFINKNIGADKNNLWLAKSVSGSLGLDIYGIYIVRDSEGNVDVEKTKLMFIENIGNDKIQKNKILDFGNKDKKFIITQFIKSFVVPPEKIDDVIGRNNQLSEYGNIFKIFGGKPTKIRAYMGIIAHNCKELESVFGFVYPVMDIDFFTNVRPDDDKDIFNKSSNYVSNMISFGGKSVRDEVNDLDSYLSYESATVAFLKNRNFFIYDKVMYQLKIILRSILNCFGMKGVRNKIFKVSRSYNIIAIDIIVTPEYDVKLLECNTFPVLQYGHSEGIYNHLTKVMVMNQVTDDNYCVFKSEDEKTIIAKKFKPFTINDMKTTHIANLINGLNERFKYKYISTEWIVQICSGFNKDNKDFVAKYTNTLWMNDKIQIADKIGTINLLRLMDPTTAEIAIRGFFDYLAEHIEKTNIFLMEKKEIDVLMTEYNMRIDNVLDLYKDKFDEQLAKLIGKNQDFYYFYLMIYNLMPTTNDDLNLKGKIIGKISDDILNNVIGVRTVGQKNIYLNMEIGEATTDRRVIGKVYLLQSFFDEYLTKFSYHEDSLKKDFSLRILNNILDKIIQLYTDLSEDVLELKMKKIWNSPFLSCFVAKVLHRYTDTHKNDEYNKILDKIINLSFVSNSIFRPGILIFIFRAMHIQIVSLWDPQEHYTFREIKEMCKYHFEDLIARIPIIFIKKDFDKIIACFTVAFKQYKKTQQLGYPLKQQQTILYNYYNEIINIGDIPEFFANENDGTQHIAQLKSILKIAMKRDSIEDQDGGYKQYYITNKNAYRVIEK